MAGEHITCLAEQLKYLMCVQRAVQGEVPRATVHPCQRRQKMGVSVHGDLFVSFVEQSSTLEGDGTGTELGRGD